MAGTQPWRAWDVEADRTVGDWVLGRRLGDGGSSSVYAADYVGVSAEFPLKAAVKVVGGIEPRRIDAIIAAYSNAPKGREIAEVYDSFETEVDGQRLLVFVLELAAYSLDDVLKTGPISRLEVDQLAARMLGALQAYHAAGLVHGDVKPSNILWCEGGWKLGDHGASAPILGDDNTTAAVLHESSLEYQPPETLDDPGRGRRHHDLWALAITLNEAACGHKPHRSRRDQITGVFTVAEELRLGVAAFVARALHPDPANRPHHAGLVELDVAATPLLAPLSVQPLTTPTSAASPTPPLERRGRSRRVMLLAGSAVLLLAVVGVTVLAALNGRDGSTGLAPEAAQASQPDPTPRPTPALTSSTTTTTPSTNTSTSQQPVEIGPVLVEPRQLATSDQPKLVWEHVDGAVSYVITVDQFFYDGGTRTGVVVQSLTPADAGCDVESTCEFTPSVPIGPAFEWWVVATAAESEVFESDKEYVLVDTQRFGAGGSL